MRHCAVCRGLLEIGCGVGFGLAGRLCFVVVFALWLQKKLSNQRSLNFVYVNKTCDCFLLSWRMWWANLGVALEWQCSLCDLGGLQNSPLDTEHPQEVADRTPWNAASSDLVSGLQGALSESVFSLLFSLSHFILPFLAVFVFLLLHLSLPDFLFFLYILFSICLLQ